MKKLFFSAIALVAFSGVSMANTIEVEVNIETEKIVRNCPKTAMLMMDLVEAETGAIDDIIEYNNLYQYYLNMCYRGSLDLG